MQDKKKDRLKAQMRAGKIKRYHCFPIVGEQTVASHSYGVAQFVRYFTGDACSKELLMAALDHDVAEIYTGDMPHTVKRQKPTLKAALQEVEDELTGELGLFQVLHPKEKAILKCADLAEMGWFAVGQLKMGNKFAGEILQNVISAMEPTTNRARKFKETLRDMEAKYVSK